MVSGYGDGGNQHRGNCMQNSRFHYSGFHLRKPPGVATAQEQRLLFTSNYPEGLQKTCSMDTCEAVAAVPCTLWKNRYGVMKLLKRISSLPFIMYSVAVLLSWQMYSKTSMSALQRRSNPPLHGLV